MNARFSEKTFIVTGGTSGMGRAVAKQLVDEGGKVIITGRNETGLANTTQQLGSNAIPFVSDAGDLADIQSLIRFAEKTFGKWDGVFANAGVAIFSPLENVNEETFDSIMTVNVKGVFFLLQQAIPFLNDGASIVINASTSGTKARPITVVYSASKAAARALTKGFATALISRNIRVNTVSPGPIDTPLWVKEGGVPKEMVNPVMQASKDANPMKRFGTPEEVANAVTFLLSSQSSYITGSEIFVDGGLINL
jgi:NAD(P)-dependent dehydrogenase (short-subunit alcohol dehydrogenase family)